MKNGKIIKIGHFQRAAGKKEVHHHMIFSSPIILLQSYKPKNQVKKKSFGSSEVYILKNPSKLFLPYKYYFSTLHQCPY